MIRHLRVTVLLRLLLAAALCACGISNPTAERSADAVRAMVSGTVSDTYEGTGEFLVGDEPPSGGPRTFSLTSVATDGRGQRRFSLFQQGNGQPPQPGRYAIAGPDYAKPSWATAAAIYINATDDLVQAYVGRDGEVVISESSGRRVAGTFRFTAVRYCARGGQNQTPCRPTDVDPAAPTVEVRGSFTAHRGSKTASRASY